MDPRKLSMEADIYLQKGDYDRAEDNLVQVVDAGYEFADVYNKLGLVYFHKRTLEKAAFNFEKALEINPKYTEASLNLSITYNELGWYDKAIEVYTSAQKVAEKESRHIDPFVKGKLANMHFEIGGIYYELGQIEDAITEFTKALALRPDFVDVKVKIGIAYRDKGFIEKAIREFEDAKLINPDYAAAGLNLGVTYFSLSKLKMAEAEWRAVQKRHPENKAAEMYLNLLKKG